LIKSALALLAFLLASPAYADITSIAAIAAGSNGDVQFNNNRRFSADTGNLTYSTSTKALTVQGLVTSTVTVNGITYYFPTSECSGGTFFRYDGGGIVTCSNPSTFTVSTGVALGVWDGAVNITTATSDLSFNADQFVVSLQGDTTASISLNASSVTVMGPLTAAAPITLSGSQFGIDKSSATLLGPNPTLGGDLSGTVTNAVVTDDSHNHTTTSISGLDISADTNLSAAPPIVLSGDTITIDKSSVTLLGPTLEADELPADGYASTYVNVTGDTMTGQLTNTSSVTVSGALGLRVTYGITAGTVSVTDDAYDASAWNGSTLVATKNAIRDKIESLSLSAQPILAIATGTTSGYTGVPTSSPTSIMVFDSATHRSQLINGTTIFIGLNSSSVTLQGQNIIKDQASLQSGAQFNVASGTVQGPMYVGTMTVTGDLAVGDDATIAGGLTVAGGSGVTVDSLTPLKCVETDASGRLVSASDLCGTGSGGSGTSLETIFGTAQSSPTATLKGDSNFKGSVTGSTMTISLADHVTITTMTVSSMTVTTQFNTRAPSYMQGHLYMGPQGGSLGYNVYASTLAMVKSIVSALNGNHMLSISDAAGGVAIGDSAKYSSGSNDLNIGYNAGTTNGGGIAIGSSAGSTGSGQYRISIGQFQTGMQSGEYSTSIGYGAGTSASSNTVNIGGTAGKFSKELSVNIGHSAGYYGKAYSVNIGYRPSLSDDVYSSSSVLVGYETGNFGGGVGGIGLGYRALYNTSGRSTGFPSFTSIYGEHNVGIGYSACSTNISGDDNICIGQNSNTTATEGFNRIAIGKNASASVNNTVKIGGEGADSLRVLASSMTVGQMTMPSLASQDCLGTDSSGNVQAGTCGGTGGGVPYSYFVLVDSDSVTWYVYTNTSGALVTSTTGTASESLKMSSVVLKDSAGSYHTVTIQTNGALVTTAGGSYEASIDKITMKDSNNTTRILTVLTTGHLITS